MTYLKSFLKNFFEWVDFPTLTATIMGGIILWILAETSKKGKLKIFITEKKTLGIYPDNSGGEHETTDLQHPQITHYYFWLNLDIYNSADHVKIARNISFKILYNDKTSTDTTVYRGDNLITSLNFEPKTLEQVHLNTTITKEQYSNIKNILLLFVNEKGRHKKYNVTA